MRKIISTDEQNNQLIYTVDKNKNNTYSHKIFLKVNNKNKHLADVKELDGFRILFIQRKRHKHLMRAFNAYGFNYVMLMNSIRVGMETIVLSDEFGIYQFPISIIMETREYLHFKQSGFEKQLFLPISEMEKYKVTNEN